MKQLKPTLISIIFAVVNSLRVLNQRNAKLSVTSLSATTYIPIPLKTTSSKKSILLVKSDEESLIEVVKSWKSGNSAGAQDQIKTWAEHGLAVWLDDKDPSATAATMELSSRGENAHSMRRPRSPSTIKTYVNSGTTSEPIYIAKSKASLLKDPKHRNQHFKDLESKGELFTNATELFNEERILSRASSIAQRVDDEFPLLSPVWKRWNNQTAKYNSISLKQVFAEYFQDFSIGDVGGKNARYIPKRGYPGTLAPGENFKDNLPIEDLPKRVLHPWPAMQDFQFHVRWPPSHPYIPQPVLWAGLNNLFIEEFVESEMNEPDDGLRLGGYSMESRDSMRIARDHVMGLCYDPKEQIPHGGMLHTTGHQIPHYNPDHGPTICAEELKAPIPDDMRHLTERWYDPTEKKLREQLPTLYEVEQSDEDLDEEEERRLKYEQWMASQGELPWQKDARLEGEELETLVAERVEMIRDHAKNMDEDSQLIASIPRFDEDPDDDIREVNRRDNEVIRARKEVLQDKAIAASLSGVARPRRALLQYTIEIFNDQQNEIMRAETEAALRLRKKKRQRRKKQDEDDIAVSDEAAAALLFSGEDDAVDGGADALVGTVEIDVNGEITDDSETLLM